MKYKGYFADYNDDQYLVEFNDNDSTTANDEVEFTLSGDSPVILSTNSGSIFDPIKPDSLTVKVVTEEFVPFFYSPAPQARECKLYDRWGSVLFHGYITPCVYSSSYKYVDTIDVECVGAISTLKNIPFTTEVVNEVEIDGKTVYQPQPQSVLLLKLLSRGLQAAGYTGRMYWLDSIKVNIVDYNVERNGVPAMTNVYISEANFFDDDDEATPWTWYEVIEEIMKFLGWSLVPKGNAVYLLDYKSLITNPYDDGMQSLSYYSIPIGYTSIREISFPIKTDYYQEIFTEDIIAAGQSSLSLDEVYNKIEVTANTYPIDGPLDEIETDNHISINKEQNKFDYNYPVEEVRRRGKRKFWIVGQKKKYYGGMPGHWAAYCRLSDKSAWKHHWYNIRNCDDIPYEKGYNYGAYWDPRAGTITSDYVNSIPNQMINTLCALPIHYSFDDTNSYDVSWNNCIMVLKYNDIAGINYRRALVSRETLESNLPILSYEDTSGSMMLKPNVGTTWITISGDLFYQRNQTQSGHTLEVVNTTDKIFAMVPFDDTVEIGGTEFEPQPLDFRIKSVTPAATHYYSARTADDADYGTGLSLLKMKVQVGDKYWDGSAWVKPDTGDPEPTFWLKHTNEPDADKLEDECVMTLKWMKLIGTTTYSDKVGEDVYAIPIASNDPDAPNGGKVKIEVMTPRFIPEEWMNDTTNYPVMSGNSQTGDLIAYSFEEFGPCVYIKNFDVKIVYTDEEAWWMDEDQEDSDVVYSNEIDENYVMDDKIELRINSTNDIKPISKSYVTDDNRYLTQFIRDDGVPTAKPQEEHLIDQYYDHYSYPCKIFTINVKNRMDEIARFVFRDSLSGTFILDHQVTDIQRHVTEATFIQYCANPDITL